MTEIIIIGGGGHAKVLANILRELPEYQVLGYTDQLDRGSLGGIQYLGDDTVLREMIRTHPHCAAAIGIGNVSVTEVRENIFSMLTNVGFQLPAIISPRAHVQDGVSIGSGTVVYNGALINAGSTIGSCCIINSGSIIEHDCSIADFVHIAPGAVLSAGVSIGRNTLIGVGALVIQSRRVGENCTIGAGAVVIHDAENSGLYIGVPAKIKK